jgi:hypothetical protein
MYDGLRKALAELQEMRAVLAHTEAHRRIQTERLRRETDRSYARIVTILLDLVRVLPQVLCE